MFCEDFTAQFRVCDVPDMSSKFSDRTTPKKKASTFGESRRKFASFGRMGDVDPSPCLPDASPSDCKSKFCEVTCSTKRLLQRQQSRRRYAASGFAFVPHTGRFNGTSWVVGPCGFCVQSFRSRKGTPGPTRKTTGRTTAFLRLRELHAGEKAGPDGSVSGPSFTHWQLGTCGNYTARSGKK
jgi:hypothetical protein